MSQAFPNRIAYDQSVIAQIEGTLSMVVRCKQHQLRLSRKPPRHVGTQFISEIDKSSVSPEVQPRSV